MDDFFGNDESSPRQNANPFDEVLVASSPKSPPAAAASGSAGNSPLAAATAVVPEAPPAAAAAAAPTAAAAVAAPTVSQKGAPQLVAELQKQIAERTAAADKATQEKELRQRKAAEAYIADVSAKRDAKLKIIKEDHMKTQSDNEKRQSELRQSGAVWQSLSLLVDLKKANAHSKKTDRMRNVMLNLSQRVEETK